MTRSPQQPLWTPSPDRVAATQLTAFMHDLATTEDFDAGGDYFALHRWSLEQPAAFYYSPNLPMLKEDSCHKIQPLRLKRKTISSPTVRQWV